MNSIFPFITAEQIKASIRYPELIDALRTAFAADRVVAPPRHHHSVLNPGATHETTLLLMPAWLAGDDLGVKIVTISPDNRERDLPAVQGMYHLLNAVTGEPRLMMDAKALTTLRTAATSALASNYLSRPDSESLLMIGTGELAPELIKAHATVRKIRRVFVWGRSIENATKCCKQLDGLGFEIEPIKNIAERLTEVDIVSCATLSVRPLLLGEQLVDGQHVDLVGAYRPDMRESDDQAVIRSRIFVDHPGALMESGDLAIPLREGKITESSIQASLFELCSGKKQGRTSRSEITLFKSVGHALEDLVAARLVAKRVLN